MNAYVQNELGTAPERQSQEGPSAGTTELVNASGQLMRVFANGMVQMAGIMVGALAFMIAAPFAAARAIAAGRDAAADDGAKDQAESGGRWAFNFQEEQGQTETVADGVAASFEEGETSDGDAAAFPPEGDTERPSTDADQHDGGKDSNPA